MDHTLEPDYHFQFEQLTNHPTMDLHLRVGEHKAEALLMAQRCAIPDDRRPR